MAAARVYAPEPFSSFLRNIAALKPKGRGNFPNMNHFLPLPEKNFYGGGEGMKILHALIKQEIFNEPPIPDDGDKAFRTHPSLLTGYTPFEIRPDPALRRAPQY